MSTAAVMLIVVLLILMFSGVPITWSLGAACVASICLDPTLSFSVLCQKIFTGCDNFSMLALPAFFLAGDIMAKGGLSKRLVAFADSFVGWISGGISLVAIVACTFFAAISGSAIATTSAVGAFMIPAMKDKGYDEGFSASICAAAGTIGVIIPPSVPFVIYGVATGTSITDLFKAGIVPGLAMGVALMIVCYIMAKKYGFKGETKKFSFKAVVKSFVDAIWALLSPVIILGGIYSGLFTPTEAACVSVFYAILVSLFIYKTIQLKDLIPFLCSSVKTYGGLAFVLAFATAFGRVLSMTKATQAVEAFIVSNFHSAALLLTVLVLVFLLLGMVMDTGPAIIILAPVLLPAVEALGVDSVHFGVVLVCCLSIGLATPPFGLDLFVAGNLSEEPPMAVARRAVPFIVSFLIALALITYVPWFSTFLVNL